MKKGPSEQGSQDTIDLWGAILGSRAAAHSVFDLGREVRTMSAPELEQITHLGPARAARVYAVVELGRRLMALPLERGRAILDAQDVYDALAPGMLDLGRESFAALYLDARHQIITQQMIALGSISSVDVDPKEILRTALRVRAPVIIVAHAHVSSGDPTPSVEDRALTRRLTQATEVVGIKLLDHIIIGAGEHYSFAASEGL